MKLINKEPTPEMLAIISNEKEVFDSPELLYAALYDAAPDIQQEIIGYIDGHYGFVRTKEVIDILRSKIKALESEILEQCRINGMGAEREATLIGKVAQQSAALKMAREALERSSKRDIAQWHNWDFDGDDDGKPPTQLNDPVLQAQLQALAAINEVLKGE